MQLANGTLLGVSSVSTTAIFIHKLPLILVNGWSKVTLATKEDPYDFNAFQLEAVSDLEKTGPYGRSTTTNTQVNKNGQK